METQPPAIRLGVRRAVFFALVIATIVLALAAFVTAFLKGGLTAIEVGMLLLFALNLPWLAIGLWNAAIGWALLRRWRGDLSRILPLARLHEPPLPPAGGVALVMPERRWQVWTQPAAVPRSPSSSSAIRATITSPRANRRCSMPGGGRTLGRSGCTIEGGLTILDSRPATSTIFATDGELTTIT